MNDQKNMLGHVTALGATLADAEQRALTAADAIRFGTPDGDDR
jgi:hypothetical protein